MRERLRQNGELARAMAAAYVSGDERGEVAGAMGAVSLIVALTVGALVASFLLPIGLEELVGVDTSNYSSGAQSMWNILDVIIVLALFLFFVGVAIAGANRV